MAAMPLHLKRGLAFAAIEARQLAVSPEESEPESGVRDRAMHRYGRCDHAGHDCSRQALKFVAR